VEEIAKDELANGWRKTHNAVDITPELNDKVVKVGGFVDNIRQLGRNLLFIVLRDGSGTVQITCKRKNISKDLFKKLRSLTKESVMGVEGVVRATEQTVRGVEIIPNKIVFLSISDSPLPIDIKGKVKTTLKKRLDWRFLDLRKPKNALIFKIMSEVEYAMREYWKRHGFIEIHTPKIMGAPSESGAELFSLEYFGKKAYLAQSPQFYKQMAICAGFERVFEIGPVFRANPSFTSRHDTEFTSVDIEMAWIRSHEDIMEFEEKWIHYIMTYIKKNYGNIIKEVYGINIKVPTIPFPRVTMKEAIEIVKGRGHTCKLELDTIGEKILGQAVLEEKKHEFVFITDFPWEVRPFYHMRYDDNKDLTKSFDLLWKGLEITTGAQREHRYEILKQQAIEKGLNLDLIKFYLDFFRYGCPPHGGFGLSITRFVMQLLDFKNVREVTLIPRDPDRLFP